MKFYPMTEKEKAAVEQLFKAVKALPRSLFLEIDQDWDEPAKLEVWKKTGQGEHSLTAQTRCRKV